MQKRSKFMIIPLLIILIIIFSYILIENNVTTLFLEATLPDKKIRLLQSTLKARGHFVKIGGTLYSDTLGYNNDYKTMMHHNVDTIVKALSSK